VHFACRLIAAALPVFRPGASAVRQHAGDVVIRPASLRGISCSILVADSENPGALAINLGGKLAQYAK
jgi:hypothetical protein